MTKHRKTNPIGENVYLLPDGSIKRDEDAIIAVQRLWRERVYAPPGTLFAPRGRMYKKCLEHWNANLKYSWLHLPPSVCY